MTPHASLKSTHDLSAELQNSTSLLALLVTRILPEVSRSGRQL